MDIVTMIDLHHGDCLDIMPTLEADSVDTIICDPPYGIQFMGRGWDRGVPGEPYWREAWRVAKPGAMLLAFGGTRTVHRLACAIEDAGWEIVDRIAWMFGQGFPKARNFPKYDMTGQDAETWKGWHSPGLKPAHEPVIVAMKPLDGTFAQNALQHGVAGLWIDGARVGTGKQVPASGASKQNNGYEGGWGGKSGRENGSGFDPNIGRWPANLIHDGSDEVLAGFPYSNGSKPIQRPDGFKRFNGQDYAGGKEYKTPAYESPGYNDTGSAARFFYCAKASRSERNAGLEGMAAVAQSVDMGTLKAGGSGKLVNGTGVAAPRQNHHPTVKPIALMRYLARLTKTPTGGVVLDPFMGSGSTGIGAVMEGRDFIGIEQDADYIEIARRRIEHWQAEAEREAAQLELQFD